MLTMSNQLNRGSRELSELLNIISNADEYNERLKTLSDAEKAANKAKSELVKAQDLDAELKKAQSKNKALDKAKAELDSHFANVKKQAEAERQFILKNANANAEALTQEIKLKKEQAEQKLADAETMRDQAKTEMEQAGLKLAEHDGLLSEAKLLKKQYLEKLAKIEKLCNELGNKL